VTLRSIATSGAAALVAAALLLAGCAGTAPDSGARPAGSGSAGATVTAPATATTEPTGTAGSSANRPAGTKDVTREDLAEIKQQLDAMQKALDNLKMPSDSDFDSAEDAVY